MDAQGKGAHSYPKTIVSVEGSGRCQRGEITNKEGSDLSIAAASSFSSSSRIRWQNARLNCQGHTEKTYLTSDEKPGLKPWRPSLQAAPAVTREPGKVTEKTQILPEPSY